MAKHLVKVLAHHRVRIHSTFEDLIVSLKSATTKDNDEYSVDKTRSSNHDLFDSLRLACLALKAEQE